MPRRKARRAKKGSSRGLLFTSLSGALLLGGAISIGLYAHGLVSSLLTGTWRGAYTTRIFARPLRLRVGDRLSPEELRARLARLGYRRVSGSPKTSGQYAELNESFDVYLRDFQHPFVRSTPVRVEMAMAAGRLSAVRLLPSEAPLIEAVLEPELVYEISGPKRVRRTPLKSDEIPPAMVNALVAIEDRRFFSHPGVDARGIARAAWRNVRAGRIAEGGSTLTQQLAKNLFLSPQRTFSRKIKEALVAIYLEIRFDKREILRLYLDSVYFGQKGPISVMGLSEAARHFFDIEPARLSVSQCALLAGLLRSPYLYNPFRFPESARARRNTVLSAMRREGYLDEKEKQAAAAEDLAVTRSGQERASDEDYFLSYVRRQLIERYADEAWMTRGLTVFTTIDPWLQEHARQTIGTAKHQAALVALEPRSGAIRALIGGKDYSQSPFDRATTAKRQPGSAFKPFVYGAALRASQGSSRWTPAALLNDTTRSYQIDAKRQWTPRNYDRAYRGKVSLRKALALSLNAATVRLAADLGPQPIIEYAQELGIRSPLRPELGLALGVSEVTLLEITGAYCAFANGGYRVGPYAIEAVLEHDGTVTEYHAPEPRPALTGAESYLMTSLLREVVRSGTARGLSRWNLGSAAGKTGTTDNGKDAWFIGYTPDIVAGVWAGSDRPAQLGMSGSATALPLWASFVRAGWPAPRQRPWPRPDGVLSVAVDPASGLRSHSGCPTRRVELFLAGTEPQQDCPLHRGGIFGWVQRLFRRPKPQPVRMR